MTYQLVHVHGSYYVRHVEADLYVGRLEPLKAGSGFTVHRIVASGNDRRKIAIIKSVDEAVPALADSYEKIHRGGWVARTLGAMRNQHFTVSSPSNGKDPEDGP